MLAVLKRSNNIPWRITANKMQTVYIYCSKKSFFLFSKKVKRAMCINYMIALIVNTLVTIQIYLSFNVPSGIFPLFNSKYTTSSILKLDKQIIGVLRLDNRLDRTLSLNGKLKENPVTFCNFVIFFFLYSRFQLSFVLWYL